MTRRFRTIVPIYDWAILTMVVTDKPDKAKIRRRLIFHGEQGVFHRTYNNCLIAFDSRTINPGIIAHEAGHLAWDILAESGVRVTRENDEAKAYLTDWIVRWANSKLKAAGIRIKHRAPTGNRLGKKQRTKRGPKW